MPYIAQSTKFEYKQFHRALQFIWRNKNNIFMITINHVTIDNKNQFYYEGNNNEIIPKVNLIQVEKIY